MSMKRLHTIDIMRGIVMCLMALDHVRDLMHVSSVTANPLDLKTTTTALFLTRWVTHLCAPVFVFLSGSSAWLFFQKHGAAETARYLCTRGIWLIAVDLILVTLILSFDLQYRMILFEVVGAIGFGFLILSLLFKKNVRTIAWIGGGIVALHGLLTLLPASTTPSLRAILSPFFTITPIPLGGDRIFLISYPPIPWLGILLLGYAAGPLFNLEEKMRSRRFLRMGVAALTVFVILRAINIYGDQAPWTPQENGVRTILSFLNISKYPPSLLFTVLWLGMLFLVLFLIDRSKSRWLTFFEVYGRVPLFYFLGHLLLIHLITLGMLFLQGFHTYDLDFSALRFGRPQAASGVGLGGIYLLWLTVVLVMYPACRAYGTYKAAHPEKTWLRYL
jgi:uncharacterized membrane protein